MIEFGVLIALAALVAWLLAGILVFILFCRHDMRATETHGPAKLACLFLVPGLAVFWPLLLWRWTYRAGLGHQTDHRLAERVARWQSLIALATFFVCPVIVAAAVLGRGPGLPIQAAANSVIPVNELLIHGATLGNAFPSIPAEVYLARTMGREYGLELQFEDGRQVLPSILYWAPSRTTGNIPPPDSVYIGFIWTWPNLWLPFPEQSMAYEGYWYAYNIVGQSLERIDVDTGGSRAGS